VASSGGMAEPLAEEPRTIPEDDSVHEGSETGSFGSGDVEVDARSEELHLLQLLIVVGNLSSDVSQSEALLQRKTGESAAERLLRCIDAIVEEKRAQFLHFRLQWLVFEYNRSTHAKFELPDVLRTPRSQHAQLARQAWFGNMTNNVDIQRRMLHGQSDTLDSQPSTRATTPKEQNSKSRPGSPGTAAGSRPGTGKSKDRPRPNALQDSMSGTSPSISPKEKRHKAASSKSVKASFGFGSSGGTHRGKSMLSKSSSSPKLDSSDRKSSKSRASKSSSSDTELPELLTRSSVSTDFTASPAHQRALFERSLGKEDLYSSAPSLLGHTQKLQALHDAEIMETTDLVKDKVKEAALKMLHSKRGAMRNGDDKAGEVTRKTSMVWLEPAASEKDLAQESFSVMDANHDGLVTQHEVKDVVDMGRMTRDAAYWSDKSSGGAAKNAFRDLDANGDKVVTREEMRQAVDAGILGRAPEATSPSVSFSQPISSGQDGEGDTKQPKPLSVTALKRASKGASLWKKMSNQTTAILDLGDRKLSAGNRKARRMQNLIATLKEAAQAEVHMQPSKQEVNMHQVLGKALRPHAPGEMQTLPPASVPVAGFLRGVEPRSPGGTFKEKDPTAEGSKRPMTCKAEALDSGLDTHRIYLSSSSSKAREGTAILRRQRRIDHRIDAMCGNEQIIGVRRYIRQLNDGDSAIKAELPPLPLEPPLPELRRLPVRSRNRFGHQDSLAVTVAYAAAADRMHRVPQAPKCLVEVDDIEQSEDRRARLGRATLDLRNLNLTDAEAVPLVEGLRQQGQSFKAMLLAGNPLLTDTFHQPLLKLACQGGMSLTELDLSGSSRMGEKSMESLTDALPRALMKLKCLRLGGTRIDSEMSWSTLCESLRGLIYLQELSLADMNIGRSSQQVPCMIAEVLSALPAMTSLNVSSNFFSFEGCKALANSLASHESLTTLDVSFNAGGFVLTDAGSSSVAATEGEDRQKLELRYDEQSAGIAAFNPISLVCEGVAKAKALTTLRLSNCQLNFDEAFILEDSIMLKKGQGVQELDVTGNPFLGTLGLRSLLRALVTTKSLHTIHIQGVSEGTPSCVAVTYDHADPTASYSLNLQHPQHRALLRSLLRRCEFLKANPSDLFTWEGGRGDEVLQMWNGSKTVPSEGEVNFSFVLPLEVDGKGDIEEILKRISEKRKIKVGLVDFTKVARLYTGLVDTATRLVCLEAVAADMILKLSHVRYLSEVDPVLRGDVIDRCLSCVASLDKLGGFDLALNSETGSKGGLSGHRASVIKLLLFNPSCPDGQYVLNVGMPSDRKLLDNLVITNQFERARAIQTGRPDLSQHGDHECIRNCTMNGRSCIWRSANVQIPPRGEVKLDYCSPFHPKKGTPATSDAVVQQIRLAIQNTEAKQNLKVSVLRTVLHRLVLNVEQCGSFIEALLQGQTDQAEIRDSPRVEAFVVLYARCNDIQEFLSNPDWGLYSLQQLTREEILTVRKRLGRLRSWAIDRCGEESLIPMTYDKSAFNESGRLALKSKWPAEEPLPTTPSGKPAPSPSKQERMAKAAEDDKRMKAILQDYGMHDNPTSLGNANWFMMDLTLNEDWIAAGVLLQCCQAEVAEVKDEPYWSEKAHLAQRGSNWLVPDDWNKEVPQVGIFGVRFLQGFSEPNTEKRLELAQAYLGW